MNKELEYLLGTGDVYKKRTLRYFGAEGTVAYTTEYHMNGKLGPFKWYVTWIAPDCPSRKLALNASIRIHDARARLYFPAYLDTRIPPENRVNIKEILDRFHLQEYDKFDLVLAYKGISPIKYGQVEEVAPMDCDIDEIHAIDEIVAEYQAVLN